MRPHVRAELPMGAEDCRYFNIVKNKFGRYIKGKLLLQTYSAIVNAPKRDASLNGKALIDVCLSRNNPKIKDICIKIKEIIK
jgi:hypothetical protein